MNYDEMTTSELKRFGHSLLEEYVELEYRKWRDRKTAMNHAYRKLGEKLDTMYGENHFSKMKGRGQIISAIGRLRKMIAARKNQKAWLEQKWKANVFLPRDQIKEALSKLHG